MRTLRWPAILLTFLIVSLVVPLGWSQQKSSSLERGLFDAMNRDRRHYGLPTLKWDDALASASRKHAQQMAQQNTLSHQFPGEPGLPARISRVGVHHSWLSENIAEGTNSGEIHAQFMKSPNHRANILDSDMDTVGIGVAESGGKWFAVEDFCKAR